MSGTWSVCPACGAVVAEPAAHADWHDAQASRVALDGAATPEPIAGDGWPDDVPVRPLLAATLDPDALTNADTLRGRAGKALSAMRGYLLLSPPTTAQVVAEVRLLTRVAVALAQLVLRDTKTIDPEET